MSLVRVLSIVLLVVAGSTACRSHHPEGDASAAAAHATPAAVPGSYDDWCNEHQVPESLCTRCNPKLIPAFQATNDWCVEHQVPESQCLKCNEALKIERPPKPTGS